jgi:two-component system cell cycle response regulator DivK
MSAPRRRVLLVEDDGVYSRLATLLLEDAGCDVTLAGTAPEGIRLAREGQPDIVFTDMNLHGRSGIDVIAAVRGDALTARIPIVALTASLLSPEDERKARAAGCSGYVEKPIDSDGFRLLLERHLD